MCTFVGTGAGHIYTEKFLLFGNKRPKNSQIGRPTALAKNKRQYCKIFDTKNAVRAHDSGIKADFASAKR
jgi:hypothetical protein